MFLTEVEELKKQLANVTAELQTMKATQGSSKKEGTRGIVCYYCHKAGHKKRDCKKRKYDERRARAPRHQSDGGLYQPYLARAEPLQASYAPHFTVSPFGAGQPPFCLPSAQQSVPQAGTRPQTTPGPMGLPSGSESSPSSYGQGN